MFFRMIGRTLVHQWKKMVMIAFTIALGASLATAMLSVMLDVGDKINQELKTYGANITVVPKAASVVNDLYDLEGDNSVGAYLNEEELGNIKTIFWAFNIVDYAPFINSSATLSDGSDVTVVGTWFNHHMALPTGEELDAGVTSLRTWWDIVDGEWIDEQSGNAVNAAMVGTELAKKLGVSVGDTVEVKGTSTAETLTVAGIFDAGGDEDYQIYTSVDTAQALDGLEGCIDSIEVSALTTPDNELERSQLINSGSV
jgi:putative ABC transport system permease protein